MSSGPAISGLDIGLAAGAAVLNVAFLAFVAYVAFMGIQILE